MTHNPTGTPKDPPPQNSHKSTQQEEGNPPTNSALTMRAAVAVCSSASCSSANAAVHRAAHRMAEKAGPQLVQIHPDLHVLGENLSLCSDGLFDELFLRVFAPVAAIPTRVCGSCVHVLSIGCLWVLKSLTQPLQLLPAPEGGVRSGALSHCHVPVHSHAMVVLCVYGCAQTQQ